jgi:hypothetical protein
MCSYKMHALNLTAVNKEEPSPRNSGSATLERKRKRSNVFRWRKTNKKKKSTRNLKKTMESIEGNGAWGFSDFKALIVRMREPFSCDVDGANVMVAPDDAAVMFDKAALGAIKKVLVIEGGKKEKNN